MPEEKQKRIRLTLKECQIIDEALRFYDKSPDPDGSKKYNHWDLDTLRRRFINLADNDGFYSRSPRQ